MAFDRADLLRRSLAIDVRRQQRANRVTVFGVHGVGFELDASAVRKFHDYCRRTWYILHAMADINKSGGGTPGGFKFNSTGTDDTSTEIIVPQIDARSRMRRTALIGFVVCALVALLYVSFVRNPITRGDLFGNQERRAFQVPEHRGE